jgi:hypothetical protein
LEVTRFIKAVNEIGDFWLDIRSMK